MPTVDVAVEEWPLRLPFVISRGERRTISVIVATIRDGEHAGRGECYPYARYGETPDSVVAQIRSVAPLIEGGGGRPELLTTLPAGAARNAVDCALWDLEAKRDTVRAWSRTGLPAPQPMLTAVTIAINEPATMEAAARSWRGMPMLKIKLNDEMIVERVAAVRRGAPTARLIVDANEAWTADILTRIIEPLQRLGVELIEQPLPAGKDEDLRGWRPPVPLCADESFHSAKDVARLAGCYGWVNVKLDKTGGLTAALDAVRAAEAHGFQIMIGCMLGTSLAMAPALALGAVAGMMDVDGPLWLIEDRQPALRFSDGIVYPPEPALWG